MIHIIRFLLLCMITSGSVFALNYLNYAEYLADKQVIVRQRPENYTLENKVLRQEVVGIALRLTSGKFRTITPSSFQMSIPVKISFSMSLSIHQILGHVDQWR